MRIAEIFRSLQGEGRLTGTPSVFIRIAGCNLRCRFCDTPYASWSPEGMDLAIDEILARVDELARPAPPRPSAARHAVLTGGEPMLAADLVPLAAALHRRGLHVTIETAGTRYLPVECDLMSVSPKLANSTPGPGQEEWWIRQHEHGRQAPDVIRRLAAQYDCQFKFVVDCLDDCREVDAFLARLPEIRRGSVMLMPQGTDPATLAEKAAWLEPYCREHGLAFCPRRHIEWFGPQRGT
ncbi:MAG: 7-carboxy-7-deazaguanine synthase QueE [Thermoguttaceae bacterium]